MLDSGVVCSMMKTVVAGFSRYYQSKCQIRRNSSGAAAAATARRNCSVSRRTIHLTWVLQRPMQMFSFFATIDKLQIFTYCFFLYKEKGL